MAGDVKIAGSPGSRFIGFIEIIFGCTSLLWYTELIWDPPDLFASLKKFYHIDNFKRVFSTGMYILSTLIMPTLLLYSTYNHASLSARKTIAVTWCISQAFSFFIAASLVYAKRTMDNTWYSIMTAYLFFSIVSIFIVTMYIGGLNDAMGREQPPPVRKRKISSVAIINAEGEDGCVANLTVEHMEQLDQFRAYVHRTSWCSDIGSDTQKSSSNTLSLPIECRF